MTKEIKLLDSAKDLKSSYIYFLYEKKVRHNNQRTQLLNFVATYNIHKIWLIGLLIPSKVMISHLVSCIFGVVQCSYMLNIITYFIPKQSILKVFFIENSVFPVRGIIPPCTPSLRPPPLGASYLYRSLKYVKKRSIDSKKCLKRPKITPNRQRKIERGAGSTCLSFLQGVLPPHRCRLCKPTLYAYI